MENPGSPGSSRAPVDETVLPAPPVTRSSEIKITYKMSTPDNCMSCFSETCNRHGRIHSCLEFPESYEIPIPTEDPDGKAGSNISVEFPAPLQSSFFDESESANDSSSDEQDETFEDGAASSASDNAGNAIDEPEIENAGVQIEEPENANAGVQYPRVLRVRLNHRIPRGGL